MCVIYTCICDIMHDILYMYAKSTSHNYMDVL